MAPDRNHDVNRAARTATGTGTDSWTTKARMPTARSGFALTAADNGRRCAVGGTLNGEDAIPLVEEELVALAFFTSTSSPHEVAWREADSALVRSILQNPACAGAYAYGRRKGSEPMPPRIPSK
jgi:hypothetical protein